jgi:hypothetical protein
MRRSSNGGWYGLAFWSYIHLTGLQDVIADEDAFKKSQESERIKLERIRKEQEHVDRTREQNARRKMDKISSREWFVTNLNISVNQPDHRCNH